MTAVHATATTGGMHTVLGDLDEAIRALFERELGERGIDGAGVSFAAPTEAWSESLKAPALNLYLYALAESRAERRVEWEQAEVDGRMIERPPPVLIDVSYVITAWADTPEHEHGLLSAALAVAYAHPALPDDVRTGALAEEWAYEHQLRTRVAQPPGEGFGAAFWAALGGRHKASVDFGVGVWCRPGGDVDQAPPRAHADGAHAAARPSRRGRRGAAPHLGRGACEGRRACCGRLDRRCPRRAGSPSPMPTGASRSRRCAPAAIACRCGRRRAPRRRPRSTCRAARST